MRISSAPTPSSAARAAANPRLRPGTSSARKEISSGSLRPDAGSRLYVHATDASEKPAGTMDKPRHPSRNVARAYPKWVAYCQAFALALLLGSIVPALAQTAIPSFWDPQRRVERPEAPAPRLLRFVTEDDYPPFTFALPDGSLAGFNVELARALCEELCIPCTIQPRRWDTL